jgi:hypothetical protein
MGIKSATFGATILSGAFAVLRWRPKIRINKPYARIAGLLMFARVVVKLSSTVAGARGLPSRDRTFLRPRK